MQVGDLVRINVVKVVDRTPKVVYCHHAWNSTQDGFGYYVTDLEVLCK
jgi:hypothetical protein